MFSFLHFTVANLGPCLFFFPSCPCLLPASFRLCLCFPLWSPERCHWVPLDGPCLFQGVLASAKTFSSCIIWRVPSFRTPWHPTPFRPWYKLRWLGRVLATSRGFSLVSAAFSACLSACLFSLFGVFIVVSPPHFCADSICDSADAFTSFSVSSCAFAFAFSACLSAASSSGASCSCPLTLFFSAVRCPLGWL